jgi:hypothetical protein
MTTRQLDPLSRRVLRALFELSRLDLPASHEALGRALSRPASEMRYVMWVLAARGLACANRVRLTMGGLLVAARLPSLGLVAPSARERRPVPARRQLFASRGDSFSLEGRVASGAKSR